MSKKVHLGTSGDTIYHWVTQFLIGLCNFSTGDNFKYTYLRSGAGVVCHIMKGL